MKNHALVVRSVKLGSICCLAAKQRLKVEVNVWIAENNFGCIFLTGQLQPDMRKTSAFVFQVFHQILLVYLWQLAYFNVLNILFLRAYKCKQRSYAAVRNIFVYVLEYPLTYFSQLRLG